MPIGLAASASTCSIVARFSLGSITVSAPIACERGCSGKSLRSTTSHQCGLHVAELEVAHDVDSQRDVRRGARGQQLAGQPGGLLPRLFRERRSAFLETLLNRLQQLEPLRGRALLRIGECGQLVR